MMCEAILPGGYQFLDIDENTFYLDLENELPVSGDAIAADHYLAKREHSYGPIFKGWKIGEKAASLFGRDDDSTFRAVSGHRIESDLRPGETVRATTVPFRWAPNDGVKCYHIRVSRREDMKLAYRPCFDVIVTQPEHHSPFAGLFNPDGQYYWHVRACNNEGVWGSWSSVWRFTWQGPRIPTELGHEIEDGKITISWKPNPRGTRPVRYEVCGSNERGFTPSKKRPEVIGLGAQPANLLCTTTKTELLVVSEDAAKPGMNCSFYRVVAIDDDGVASGPSGLVELPHPFIYSRPVTEAIVGEPYRYKPRALDCIGDLQYRYAQPNMAFREEEGYEFELAERIGWLSLDKSTGTLAGTPGPDDRWTHRVTVICQRMFPDELKPSDYRSSYFLKDVPRFQSSCRQTFDLTVQ